MFFGLDGFSIFLGYLLTILSALACLIYGIRNFNKGQDPQENQEIQEEVRWEKEQLDFKENL